jgi:hypothetical protein
MVGMEQLEVHSKVLSKSTGLVKNKAATDVSFPVIPRPLDTSFGGKHDLVEHSASQEITQLWRLQAPRRRCRSPNAHSTFHIELRSFTAGQRRRFREDKGEACGQLPQ